MFKRLLLFTFSCLSVMCYAQKNETKAAKIKIKKDQLLINDTIVGNWESVGKIFRPHQYHFKSVDNKPLISFEDASAPCLFKDSIYTFTRITFHGLNKVVNVNENELKASVNIETTVAKCMVNKYQLVDNNGKLNQAIIDDFIRNNPDTAVPNHVRQALDYQRNMSQDIGFIAPRDVEKIMVLKADYGCQRLSHGTQSMRCYGVFQDGVLAGRIRVIGYNAPSSPNSMQEGGSMRIEFINAKDARIAVYKDYSFPAFMVYKTDINYNFMKNPFKNLQSSEDDLIRSISKWLIEKKYW